ncbi:MAG TPA: hypothetical protein VK569_08080, partial [Bacteroidota bacterium]|nr:hypothetical protein [Bacteroidota bacterium]
IRGARLNSVYRAQWFDPREGTWLDAGGGRLVANKIGIMELPGFPGDADWGIRLTYEGPASSGGGKAQKGSAESDGRSHR